MSSYIQAIFALWYDVTMWFLQAVYANVYLQIILIFLFVIISLPPLMFGVVLFITSFFAAIHGFKNGLKDIAHDNKSWDHTRQMIANGWRRFGRIYHGFEVQGFENIPAEGPALLVCYHATCPYDMYLMAAEIFLAHKRVLRIIGERAIFLVPGLGPIVKLLGAMAGTVDSCTEVLKEGGLLMVAPGGAYEAQFNDTNYELKWRNRKGYAKVAIQAKVPIIPVFTVNIGEVCRSIGKRIGHPLYLWLRIPLVPVYGGYPVKLKTIIGKPIPYDPNITVEELAKKTRTAVEALIKEHQRIPGSIAHALMDRVLTSNHKKVA